LPKEKTLIESKFGDNEITQKRLKNLIIVADELNAKYIFVITKNIEKSQKIGNKTIKFIPLWKWLLE